MYYKKNYYNDTTSSYIISIIKAMIQNTLKTKILINSKRII